METGELLVIGADVRTRYLARYAWDGELLWQRRLRVHHDVSVTDDGTLLALASARRRGRGLYPDHRIADIPILRLSASGEVIAQRSLFDIVASRPDFELNLIAVPDNRGFVDLFHSNSVRQMNLEALEGDHAIYDPANVVVSTRHQDRIVIFNWETGELIWEWGAGEVSGPHDAAILATGNLLVFDNGLDRRWSRVIEVDPRTESIVWEYEAPVPTDFSTASRGASQRLDNGNTLITESDAGHAFEVTPAGKIVWEYWVPLAAGQTEIAPGRPTIVRLYRHHGDWLDALLVHG